MEHVHSLADAVFALDTLLSIDLDNYLGYGGSDQDKCGQLWVAAQSVYGAAQYAYPTVAFTPDEGDYLFDLKGSNDKIGAVLTRVDAVYIAHSPLLNADGDIGLLSPGEFNERCWDWRKRGIEHSTGRPWAACVLPDRTLAFDRPFDGETAADTDGLYLTGAGYPRPFTWDSVSEAEWAVDERLRWAVIKRAAYNAGSPFARSAPAVATLTRYLKESDADAAAFLADQGDLTSPLAGSAPTRYSSTFRTQ